VHVRQQIGALLYLVLPASFCSRFVFSPLPLSHFLVSSFPFGSLSRLQHCFPVNKWVSPAKSHTVSVHLNGQGRDSANTSNHKDGFTSDLSKSLWLPKLLYIAVHKLFGVTTFKLYWRAELIAIPPGQIKCVSKVIEKLLRLALNPLWKLKIWARLVDQEIRQVAQLAPIAKGYRRFV
jgi:hypothetical protein